MTAILTASPPRRYRAGTASVLPQGPREPVRSVRDIPARSLAVAMIDRSYEDDSAYRRRPGNQDQTKY